MCVIKEETLKNAYKPYDIVSDENGNVGFIQEVSVNDGQSHESCQIDYAVNWLVVDENYILKHAWYTHKELKKHCNLFTKIAKSSCNPMGNSEDWVDRLFKQW